MKAVKYLCSFIIVVSLILPIISNAFSINIDGIIPDAEWDNAHAQLISEGESNSRIKYAIVKNIIKAEENAFYLCFMFIDPFLEPDNTAAGISLTVENSDSFTFDISDSLFHEDAADYSFDGAIKVDENNGATCEVRIGYKNGLPRNISLDVRFIDSSGAYSNEYPISVINSFYSESTELIINQTENNTTRRKTTVYEEDEKTTDYTLKKPTTKPEKKKTEFYIQTSPPYSYTGRTKATKKTTLAKTTTNPKTTKIKASSVKHKNQIIVSQEYSTAENPTSSTLSASESSVLETTESISSAVFEAPSSLSKGTKYKIIIGVLSAVSFTAVAVASAMNKKPKNNPDSQ